MVPKLTLILVLILLCFCAVKAQQTSTSLKELTAWLAESLPEAEDLTELTANLSFYRQHPVDLNHSSPDELKGLLFLSALQISNLFSHLRTNGKLHDLLELQGVDGFDPETISRLLPYVKLRTESEFQQLRFHREMPLGIGQVLKQGFQQAGQKGNSEILLRYARILEKQKGFRDLPGSRYLGTPEKLRLRYQYSFGKLLSFSLLGEKDAGESFFSGSNKSGFDFVSGSLSVNPGGKIMKIIIGDYSLQFGQGLTLWSGFSLGKGPDVAGVAKRDTGLKPYTSTNEFSFFRGIAVKFNLLKIINITNFISIRNLDASFSVKDSGRVTLSAISTSGLHRTATEIRNKKVLGQFIFGTAAEYQKESFSAGLIAYHSSYSHEFITGNLLYKKYGFAGKELTNLGFHYNYTFRNIYFFGEAAQSLPEGAALFNSGSALLNGAMASLSPKVSVVLVHRAYTKEHVNFYSQALGEAKAANEKGLYSGINYSIHKKWMLSVYADIFWAPWAKYRVDGASSGCDLMGQLNFKPNKAFKAHLKFRTTSYQQNESSGLPEHPLAIVSKDLARVEIQWKLTRKVNMQNRLEVSRYRKGLPEAEYGYLIYQDVDYHPLSSRFSGNLRLAYFHTDSYNSRIYAYEDDVLHGAGSGLYNGEGLRTVFNLSYRVSRQFRIWSRYASFYYPGKDKIGTGLQEITGSVKSEIKLQLRYQF